MIDIDDIYTKNHWLMSIVRF